MFPLCLPSFSNLRRLVLKPPTQQFLQSSSTYLIMDHRRKQKFSLIGKPHQQNQARDGNLMITERITLPDVEGNDRREDLCRGLAFKELDVLTLCVSCQVSVVLSLPCFS